MKLRKIIYHIILLAVSLLAVFPFLWMFLISLKTERQIYLSPIKILSHPFPLHWNNYTKIFSTNIIEGISLYRLLFNTMFVFITVVTARIIICFLTGYTISRMRFAGRKIIWGLLLFAMITPVGMTTLLGHYRIIKLLHWYDTYMALIFPSLLNTGDILLSILFFKSIPREIEDASLVDGCSRWQTINKIFIPLSKPLISVIFIFTFVSYWKLFMEPLVFTASNNMKTLEVGLFIMKSLYEGQINLQMAVAIVSVIPILVVFIIASNVFIEGTKRTLRGVV